LTQTPPQSVRPAQSSTQLPWLHTSPVEQVVPQAPQLDGSLVVSTQTPLQEVSVPQLPVQTPERHASFAGQALEQPPQFAGSVARLTHAPLHDMSGAVQPVVVVVVVPVVVDVVPVVVDVVPVVPPVPVVVVAMPPAPVVVVVSKWTPLLLQPAEVAPSDARPIARAHLAAFNVKTICSLLSDGRVMEQAPGPRRAKASSRSGHRDDRAASTRGVLRGPPCVAEGKTCLAFMERPERSGGSEFGRRCFGARSGKFLDR
jgi:hypothetical protein